MLFDPKWQDKRVKALLDLRLFKYWLSTKSGRYDYHSVGDCVIALYLQEAGYPDARATRDFVKVDGKVYDLPPEMDFVARVGKKTFENAFRRAKWVLWWHRLVRKRTVLNRYAKVR